MGKYSQFHYGAPENVLYGIQSSVLLVDPLRGPSIGGNSFVLKGEGFQTLQWDDTFEGAVLGPKWSDISVGSGSIATGTYHLELSTGTTVASVSGVQSTQGWGDAQGEVRCIIPAISERPTDVVEVLTFALWSDVNNRALATVEQDAEGILTLNCEVYTGGVLADEMRVPLDWITGLTVLKILRWGSTVYFYANGTEVFSSTLFVNTVAYFQVYSGNITTTYNLAGLRIEHFKFSPFAVFQEQPVHDTVIVSPTRLRGLVPASRDIHWQSAAYEGLVNVSVVANGTATSTNAYEYYYVAGMKMINSAQASVGMAIIDDPQLVTPDDLNKGI